MTFTHTYKCIHKIREKLFLKKYYYNLKMTVFYLNTFVITNMCKSK